MEKDLKDSNKDALLVNNHEWHPQQESILQSWAQTATIYSLMHDQAHRKFKIQTLAFTIPVIVISSITGTANFATNEFDPEHRYKLSMIIGCMNLGAGLITTLAQFLRVNELCEGHRQAYVAFSKFARNVSITLSLPLYDRPTCGTVFLESCRQEYDRLLEQTPVVPTKIISKFKKEYSQYKLNVPCFGFIPTQVYSPSVDAVTKQETINNVRNSLLRLKSIHHIDSDTEEKIMENLGDIEMQKLSDDFSENSGSTCCPKDMCQ
tara:strand:- start:7156 stop:7947 length:792 start_codon:yes stop_codon:yes gene_type:complete